MLVVTKTHAGLVRENNEDAILVQEPYIFAIADGMGGHASGEIASRAALKAFGAATHSLRKDSTEHIRDTLIEAARKANDHVLKMSVSNDDFTGMGTTLTALYLPGNGTAYFCHVGDSRLYIYRDGLLERITHDHTYVEDLKDKGKITSEEAAIHPDRHLLMQAIGVDENIHAQCVIFSITPTDRLLICSDGLSDMVTDVELAEIIQEKDVELCADNLLEKALNNGGRDNISLILIDMAQSPKDNPEEVKVNG
ncbi:MAG: Stp1/IreP family PP2C-type Ser/Thr phosphatase [Phascolarctobacterium sp.]|nr:Stp1/IreP family PP2C-type Ser/Thr phosphatase [Phascolarctobacterium sp.]